MNDAEELEKKRAFWREVHSRLEAEDRSDESWFPKEPATTANFYPEENRALWEIARDAGCTRDEALRWLVNQERKRREDAWWDSDEVTS